MNSIMQNAGIQVFSLVFSCKWGEMIHLYHNRNYLMQWLLFPLIFPGLPSIMDRYLLIYIYIYIYSFILNVDATHCPLKLLLLLDFYHCIADVEGTINDDSHDIFMGDYLFVNIATEKSIRRYGGRFNGIVNRAYFLFPKV